MTYKKLQGQRFGRLTVMAYHGRNKWGIATWFCECDCGGIKIVQSGSLNSGNTQSCGCIGKEHPSHTIHGGRGTRLYEIWKSMNKRCNNMSSKNYKDYGRRGITICKEWEDYSIFRNWALSNGYDSKLTIDRINNNGNYEPDNCRWATYNQQARNKTNTVYFTINGITKPLIEWAEILNIPYIRAIERHRRGRYPFK